MSNEQTTLQHEGSDAALGTGTAVAQVAMTVPLAGGDVDGPEAAN